MSKVITLNAPIYTSFGKIKKIIWKWKPPRTPPEHSGFKVGQIKFKGDNKEIIIPIKIIPENDAKDALIHPLQGKDMTFWIKEFLLDHLRNCDTCLRYVLIHEFTHLMSQFHFPLPWELRGFGKETIYTIHHYIIDAFADRWNVLHKNFYYDDPINYYYHMEQENKIKITLTSREELFENYIFYVKFAPNSNSWKRHLYNHAYRFPNVLRDKYQKLLDALSGDYNGPEFPIYELVRDIAELMLCNSKEDILKRELKRRFYTLSDIGAILLNDETNNFKDSMHQLWNKRLINIFQMRNCLFDWKNTFNRIINTSSDDLRYIDEFLSEPTNQNMFSLSYFLKNDIG